MSLVVGLAGSRVMMPDDRALMLTKMDVRDMVRLGIKRFRMEVSLSSARDANNNVIGAREFTDGLLSFYVAAKDYIKGFGIGSHLLLPNQIIADASPATWRIPPSPAAWADYVAAYAGTAGRIAAKLPDVDLIELWNEPNNQGHDSYLDPARYAELYHAARVEIRKHSSAPVCAGGLFQHAMSVYGGANWQNAATPYLRSFLNALAGITGEKPDCVGAHPYLNGGGVLDVNALASYFQYWNIELDSTVKIHITEAGWQSPQIFDPATGHVKDGVSLTQHDANIAALCQAAAAEPQVASCMVFTKDDGPVGRWGIIGKPAEQALMQAAHTL